MEHRLKDGRIVRTSVQTMPTGGGNMAAHLLEVISGSFVPPPQSRFGGPVGQPRWGLRYAYRTCQNFQWQFDGAYDRELPYGADLEYRPPVALHITTGLRGAGFSRWVAVIRYWTVYERSTHLF